MNDRKQTLGGASKHCCSSRIRLFEPLTRKVPGTSVAEGEKERGKSEHERPLMRVTRTVLFQI